MAYRRILYGSGSRSFLGDLGRYFIFDNYDCRGDDDDWYRVQLAAGANLFAQALLTSEQIVIELRGPNGCPVDNDGIEIAAPCPSNQNYLNIVKGNPITVSNLDSSGTYYLLVTSKLNNDTNYQLKVVADTTAVSNCLQVDVEPNNVAVLARPITPGAPAVTGSICAEGHPAGADVDCRMHHRVQPKPDPPPARGHPHLLNEVVPLAECRSCGSRICLLRAGHPSS